MRGRVPLDRSIGAASRAHGGVPPRAWVCAGGAYAGQKTLDGGPLVLPLPHVLLLPCA